MAHVRKHQRRIRALSRYPTTAKSRKGKRTEAQWEAERQHLMDNIASRRRARA